MKPWQSLLCLIFAGIGPVTIAIVSLQQFDVIGLDTALLLGLLYLLFISTHVWCKIFTKIPPSPSEQPVDSLPCYEEAVKSEPPSYYALYPVTQAPADVTVSSETTPLPNESKSTEGRVHLELSPSHLNNSPDVANNDHSETPDSRPIFGKQGRGARKSSRPTLIPSQSAASVQQPPAALPDFPASETAASCNTPEAEESKTSRMLSKMLENIVHPLDHV